MNRTEFDQWASDYFAAFPGTLMWLNEKSPDMSATLRTWHKTLEHIPLHVAAAVTDRMVAGQLAPVAAYERDQTALHVRAYGNRILSEQRQRHANAKHREQLVKRKSQSFPAKGIFAAASLLRAAVQVNVDRDDWDARYNSAINDLVEQWHERGVIPDAIEFCRERYGWTEPVKISPKANLLREIAKL